MRDTIEDKKVLLVKVDTLKNTSNALTKSVSFEKFSWCRETMGVFKARKMLGPYNTSDAPINIAVLSLINIVVPLLSQYFYYCAP